MASPVRPRGRQINAYQLIALLLAFVLVSGVGGVLAAGLLVPLAAGANTAAESAVEVFDELPADLEPGPLAEQSRVYANDGKTLLATFYTENRIVVPLEEVSPYMQNAVIAIEDKRFWQHGGVDIEGIPRAVVNNMMDLPTQGASTLTQQYVKNVLIEQAVREDDTMGIWEAREDTLGRKAREAKLAISIEKRMSKEEILQGYLNIAQFGASSLYGVETAAQHYFSKSAKDLNAVEAATIAGITKAPSKYDPTRNPEESQKRRNIVLNTMYQQGYITKDEYDQGRATAIGDTLKVKPVEVGCQAAKGSAFFCDYVTKVLISDPVFGETEDDRKAQLYRGGLDIYTTLDPAMQKAAVQEARAAVPADDPSGLEDAIVSVEPGTGKILAMAQNRAYDATEEPAKGTTAVNYSVDQSHGSSNGFSPGSTWKVFVLAEWLKSGKSLYQSVNANSRSWNNTDFDFCGANVRNEAEAWRPGNSDGNDDKGQISVLQATYNSINTAYVSMESQLRLCDIKSTAESIGYRPSMLKDQDTGAQMVPSMVIGTQNSSPLQMAAAYATFASGGTYCEPIAITKIVSTDGEELPVPEASCNKNALDPEVANTVTYALQSVMTQGSGRAAQLDGRTSAGKTGTSQLNRHTWFIGYTPQVATAVWIGNAENDVEMRDMVINGQFERWWFGSTLAAPTWKAYMDRALEGQPAADFGAPDWGKVNAPAPPPPPPSDDGGDSGDGGGGDSGGGDDGDSGGDGGGDSGGDGEDRGDRGDRGNAGGRGTLEDFLGDLGDLGGGGNG
ncbi:transglycosylase domain-containing protein [Cellulosimicrobium marinum]|uniref:transglycosylase domain-containing protein n=1 Tax=Cellulosimicrobium marinum TaxID=1638992 RepID=UPI001E59528A|nr:transglycosylase domain-containing protein [Cellulosimicrobium marinum]MCB7136282.1 transglycosylase domain-containing protein [Cellulosimicrobium marinum]